MGKYYTIKGKAVGDKAVLKKIARLQKRVGSKIIRKGLDAGGSVALKGSKRRIPNKRDRTKALRRSLGKRIFLKAKDSKGRCLIQPRSGFWVPDGYRPGEVHKPEKVAHWVEYGHGGPYPAPPHSFFRDTLIGDGAAINAAMTAKYKAELAKI